MIRLACLGRDRCGAASAEFAMILPGIAFVLLNVVDLSSYIWTKMQVDLAAHEAVGAARVLCDTAEELPATVKCGATTLSNAMTAAAQSTTLGTGVSLVSANTDERYYCATAAGVLTEVALASGTPPANCSDTVAGSTSTPGLYIQATASRAFTPVFPGASVASLLTTPITRTAWLRLQ